MQINRNNYESFLIDYLDGVLDEWQKKEVEAFLLSNNDIALEFESLQTDLVIPQEVKFKQKEELLKIPFQSAKADDPFFSQKCIEKIEGILPPGENQLFEQMVHKSPDHQHAFQTYCKTKLPADNLYFDEKILIKTDETNPVIDNKNFTGYAIAYHEGWLNSNEQKAVEKYISRNDFAQKDFLLLGQLKFKPQYNILYPDKSRLYKERIITNKFQKNIIYWGSVAALFVIGAYAFYTSQSEQFTIHQQVVEQKKVNSKLVSDNKRAIKSDVPISVELDKLKQPASYKQKELVKVQADIEQPVYQVDSSRVTFELNRINSLTVAAIETEIFERELASDYRQMPEIYTDENMVATREEQNEKLWLKESVKNMAEYGIKKFNKSGKGKINFKRENEKNRMKVEIETRYFAFSTTKSIKN
jgi:hypothetical protein